MSDLNLLLSLCKNSVSVEVNRHRDFYQSVEEYINEMHDKGEDIAKDVLEEMIRRDTIVEVQAYPDNAIGFFVVEHYDVNTAIKRMIRAIERDREERAKVLNLNPEDKWDKEEVIAKVEAKAVEFRSDANVLEHEVVCLGCNRKYIPAKVSGVLELNVPPMLANNFCSRTCMDINSEAAKQQTFDEWLAENKERIDIELAESGADREMGFDVEREYEQRYEQRDATDSQDTTQER